MPAAAASSLFWGGPPVRPAPTDAAGGYAFSGDLARLRAIGLHPEESLGANDSYPLLLKAGTLLRTGPTRTNVMDVCIILVRPK